MMRWSITPSCMASSGCSRSPMMSLPLWARAQPSRQAPKSLTYDTGPATGNVIARTWPLSTEPAGMTTRPLGVSTGGATGPDSMFSSDDRGGAAGTVTGVSSTLVGGLVSSGGGGGSGSTMEGVVTLGSSVVVVGSVGATVVVVVAPPGVVVVVVGSLLGVDPGVVVVDGVVVGGADGSVGPDGTVVVVVVVVDVVDVVDVEVVVDSATGSPAAAGAGAMHSVPGAVVGDVQSSGPSGIADADAQATIGIRPRAATIVTIRFTASSPRQPAGRSTPPACRWRRACTRTCATPGWRSSCR